MIAEILATVLAFGYPFGYLAHRAHLQRLHDKRVEQALKDGEDAFVRGTALLSEEVLSLRAIVEDERGQKGRFQSKIAEVTEERDQWVTLYHEQSIGHGNAQTIMMETIEIQARALRARGIKVTIPSVIQQLRDDFRSQHEEPALAAAQKLASEAPTKIQSAP